MPEAYKLPELTRRKVMGLRPGQKEVRVCFVGGEPITPWMGRLREVLKASAAAVAEHGPKAVYLQIHQVI